MHYNGYSCPGTETIYRQTETEIMHAQFSLLSSHFLLHALVLREGSPHYAMHITSIFTVHVHSIVVHVTVALYMCTSTDSVMLLYVRACGTCK